MDTQKLKSHLEKVLEYAMKNYCTHEETHRGGMIWEICDSCGMKWADDEGGIPKNAHDYPKVYQEAFDYLDSLEKKPAKENKTSSCKSHPESKMIELGCLSCILGYPTDDQEKEVKFCNSCANLDLCREMHECMNERD